MQHTFLLGNSSLSKWWNSRRRIQGIRRPAGCDYHSLSLEVRTIEVWKSIMKRYPPFGREPNRQAWSFFAFLSSVFFLCSTKGSQPYATLEDIPGTSNASRPRVLANVSALSCRSGAKPSEGRPSFHLTVNFWTTYGHRSKNVGRNFPHHFQHHCNSHTCLPHRSMHQYCKAWAGQSVMESCLNILLSL